MSSIFDKAIAAGVATLVKVAGSAVVYRAGSIEIAIPDAIKGRTDYEVTGETGAVIRASMTDWLIDPARLTYNSAPLEPMAGHRIEQTINGVKRTFEVAPLGGEPCYRFSDPTRDRYRIHTNEVTN